MRCITNDYNIKKIIKDERGLATPYTVAIVMVLLLLFCAMFETLRVNALMKQIDTAVERSVVSVATENWDQIYQGVRQGYAGTWSKEKTSDAWKEMMDNENILRQLKNILEVTAESSTKWVRKDDQGNILYAINPEAMKVTIKNTPFDAAPGEALKVETISKVTIYWLFAGFWPDLPPIEVNVKTVSGYTPKF